MTYSPESSDAPLLRVERGDSVRTPSGAIAEILDVYPMDGEALVVWPDGSEARFRLKKLRALE